MEDNLIFFFNWKRTSKDLKFFCKWRTSSSAWSEIIFGFLVINFDSFYFGSEKLWFQHGLGFHCSLNLIVLGLTAQKSSYRLLTFYQNLIIKIIALLLPNSYLSWNLSLYENLKSLNSHDRATKWHYNLNSYPATHPPIPSQKFEICLN